VFVPAVSGCGVKGDPLPPEKPVDLGRGRPTYRRATEKIRIEKTPPTNMKTSAPDDEDKDGDYDSD
jgi:hypothetical protein